MVITLCAVSKCGERPNVKCESAMQCGESVHCTVVRGKMCWRFIRGGCWED